MTISPAATNAANVASASGARSTGATGKSAGDSGSFKDLLSVLANMFSKPEGTAGTGNSTAIAGGGEQADPDAAATDGQLDSDLYQQIMALFMARMESGPAPIDPDELPEDLLAALQKLADALSGTLTLMMGTDGDPSDPLAAALEQLAAALGNAQAGADGTISDTTDTPDPLAAVIDLFVNALTATGTTADNGTVTLDAASGNALKALNDFLAALSARTASDGMTGSQALSAEAANQLTSLDQLLANQNADPRIDEIRSRIAALLGTDTAKSTATDTTTALAAQTAPADKSAGTTTRDALTQIVDGAKTGTAAQNAGTDANAGDMSGQRQASSGQRSESGQADGSHRALAAAGFAAQVIADGGKPTTPSDTGTTISVLPAQDLSRAQTLQMQTLSHSYAQQATGRLDIPQIAFQIASHVSHGVNSFQIRLDPPEMGRIDVRLDLDQSGAVSAKLTVDRAETLDLLQRDARALERALAQTGLDAGKTNLEFSLKQNPFAQQQFDQGQDNRQNMANVFGETETTPLDAASASAAPLTTLYRGFVRPGGVNLVA